jgi:hypothetical protein
MLYINDKNCLTIKIKIAKTFFSKALGLMFKTKFNYALIFYLEKQAQLRNSIHMLFVFTPICAIFLDNNKKVVDKVILKPFCLHYSPKKPCTYLIELPIKHYSKFNLGDIITWQPK